MSTSKNAYEIRLEILKEANSNLWQSYHNAVESSRLDAAAKGDVTGAYFMSVNAPSPENIIEYAEKLYKFVSRD